MKRLGKLVFMSEAEFWTMFRRTRDADNDTYRAGFNAGKWHSAGGYSKALMLARKEVSQTRHLLLRWRPIVEAIETTPGQFTNDG